MTAHPAPSSASQAPLNPLPLWASVLLWTGLQLLSLVLSAMDVPLWSRHPAPPVALAGEVMVTAQLVALALLFPLLLQSMWHTAVMIAIAALFSQLAGLLSDQPVAQLLRGSVVVAAWAVTLRVWMHAVARYRGGQWVLQLSMLTATLGGGLLAYLASEFAGGGEQWIGFAPLPTGVAAVRGPDIWIHLLLPAVSGGIGGLLWIVSHRR